MLFFGHLGIGERIARMGYSQIPEKYIEKRKGFPVWAALLGTVLPDLIDKSLYYIPNMITGKSGSDLGLFSGSRSIGHSLLFLFVLGCFSIHSKKPILIALFLGVCTHIPLDLLCDALRLDHEGAPPETNPKYAYFFPFLGFHFPVIFYKTVGQHIQHLMDPYVKGFEVFGLFSLFAQFLKPFCAINKRIGTPVFISIMAALVIVALFQTHLS